MAHWHRSLVNNGLTNQEIGHTLGDLSTPREIRVGECDTCDLIFYNKAKDTCSKCGRYLFWRKETEKDRNRKPK